MSASVADIAVNHSSTSSNHKLKETLTHRHKLPNVAAAAAAHVVAGSEMMHEFDRQCQCRRLEPYHSRSGGPLNRYVYYQAPQLAAAAVDAYIQLQTLAAAMRTSPPCTSITGSSVTETMSGGHLAVTHQRRHHMCNVPQPLKLAATGVTLYCHQQQADHHINHHLNHHFNQYNHNQQEPQQQQQQNRDDLCQSCLSLTTMSTSPTQSQPNDRHYGKQFTRHDVTSGQIGQQCASYSYSYKI